MKYNKEDYIPFDNMMKCMVTLASRHHLLGWLKVGDEFVHVQKVTSDGIVLPDRTLTFQQAFETCLFENGEPFGLHKVFDAHLINK